MTDEHNEKTSGGQSKEYQVSRRGTLKAGAAGMSGLFGLNGLVHSSDDTVEIPVAFHGETVLSTTKVPRSWYEHVTHVRSVFDRIHKTYGQMPWYDYSAQTAGDTKVGELYQHGVKVHATDVAVATAALPTEVDGVPISVEPSREKHLDDHLNSTCDENTGTYNCVPGAGYLTGHGCWSSTCIAKDSGGTHYLMTSRHPYGKCGDDVSGMSTYHGESNSVYVGDVKKYNHEYDVVLVDQSGNVNGIDNKIIGESYPVRGHISESYCDTLISNFDTTHHNGISTGRTSGYLDEKIQRNQCGKTVEYLKLTSNAGSGDSGGPHYWINDEYNYIGILGPHEYHSEDTYGNHYRSFCPAGYAINNDLGWRFGDDSSTC